MSRGLAFGLGTAVCLMSACAQPPLVRFEVEQPLLNEFNPLAGAVTEYALRTTDGLLVSSTNADGRRLDLGKLPLFSAAQDLQLQIMSGSELRGMGRFRDVRVQSGRSGAYETAVRKPLVFVGAALPTEGGMLDINAAQILDPTSSFDDLAHPPNGNRGVDSLPPRTSSTASTWDARFVLAGRQNAIALYNTSNGQVDGEVRIDFTPTRLVVAPRDVAMAALRVDSATSGAITLFPDLEAVRRDPTAVEPVVVAFADNAPRAAAFSADGERLYVLLGAPTDLDACNANKSLAASELVVLKRDGTEEKRWTLPGFAADVAIDSTGKHPEVIVSLSRGNTVIAIDPNAPEGTPDASPLLTAICPASMRIVGEELFVVTAGRDASAPGSNQFLLERLELAGSRTRTSLPFAAPSYEVPLGLPTEDDKVAFAQRFFANSIFGYELAVTPDGTRAVFATRARYVQSNELLRLFSNVDCTVNIDVAEYGVYFLDTRTGASFYQPRSQLIAGDPLDCFTSCEFNDILGGELFTLECIPSEGISDRASGITVLFGG